MRHVKCTDVRSVVEIVDISDILVCVEFVLEKKH